MFIGVVSGLGAALAQSVSFLGTRHFSHGRGEGAGRMLLSLGHVWMGVLAVGLNFAGTALKKRAAAIQISVIAPKGGPFLVNAISTYTTLTKKKGGGMKRATVLSGGTHNGQDHGVE
jgi:hypothetical protein